MADILTIAEDRSRTGELLAMKPLARSVATYEPMGHLYLGTLTKEDTDIRKDISLPASMNVCIAQFTAAIHNIPEIYQPGQDEPVWMHVKGTKSEMNTEFNPRREDAVIIAEFTEKEERSQILRTTKHGLLASDQDQFISVDIYKGDVFQGTIRTDIQSKPRREIHLDIYRHSVTIHINGWRVFDVPVEWI
ncbi:MAG: hypothetical protein LUD15_02570 [Bacteroides sp.]|nr:hypothetical protein [Bacteroides sp.]